MPSNITSTEEFVKNAFIQHPHFSFNDWSVMYNHSVTVKDLALEIATNIDCDKEVIAIAALLHDIGKTYETDEKTLQDKHESFNIVVSEQFLESLQLPKHKIEKIKQLISYSSDSTEMKIIKDADAIALYKDKRLNTLFIGWAVANKLDAAIQRKLDKFDKLNFEISKEIAGPFLQEMKQHWSAYLNKPL